MKSLNTVESSGIITVDLLDFAPAEECVFLDITDYLYQGLILKEKEFKQAVADTNWNEYADKSVAIGCSADVIIPLWAYMTLACQLESVATRFDICSKNELILQIWNDNIASEQFEHLADKKVVIRARPEIDPALYSLISKKLKPIVKTLMYGEAGLPKVIWKN